MPALPHQLDRTVVIHATPETVFRFFTDPARWAAWWGAGSTIDARPGGALLIRHPNGVEASGEVLDVSPPERIVFTYGYASGTPIAPGSSRVTISLTSHAAGTRLHLLHELADEAARDEHVQGWRYQLAVFANVVADEVNSGAAEAVDAWFGAWGEPDAAVRARLLGRVAAPELRFRDRFSNVDGLDDLVPHITAYQRFMAGVRMRRAGAVRHCQGMVLADWIATGSDDQERARGTNVFVCGPTGRIESVVGITNPAASG
jgi:uncharacterized protein YndB with AHSA1/START domain